MGPELLISSCVVFFSCPSSTATLQGRSPGSRSPWTDSGPPRSPRCPRRRPGQRRVQKVTGGDRGRQGRAAPPRGGAANFSPLASCRALRPRTDFLHRPRERGGAPFPAGGQAGREGAGRTGARQVGADTQPGRIVSTASDPARAAAARAGAAGSCCPEIAAPFRCRRSPRSLCVCCLRW